MRILTVGNMYPPHHLGGYELTWRSAVEHLRSAGHEVRVLTTDHLNPGTDADDEPDVRRELRWYWRDHDFPRLTPRERLAVERHNARVLARELEELRPHVVSWWAMGGMSLSLIEQVRRRGLPAMGVVGDAWMLYGPDVDGWTRLVRRLGPLGPPLARAAGVPTPPDLSRIAWLFNSQASRRMGLESRFRLERAEVAHPGVDAGLFRPAGLHGWGWRLLYVGRIDERKGIDLAVEALAGLPEEASLTVLGSGDDGYLGRLRSLAERLGVAARVSFGLRPRDELPHAYAEADAVLFPTRWQEPWGLVPLEAMAVGTPVVASARGGAAEYLVDGENALVVSPDAGELAAAVGRLATDPALRTRLREGGEATAARYTERAYNEAIATALERAASE